MQIYLVGQDRFAALQTLPERLPDAGFVWIGITRTALETALPEVQARLHAWQGGPLVELHVSDLLNDQLPSHYDYTSWYDMLVFRRLAAAVATDDAAQAAALDLATPQQLLASINTSPVGFVAFDRVLISVHPDDCAVLDHFAQRLKELSAGADARSTTSRLPTSPADLMLRMVNFMVDNYLDLRRLLTRHLGRLQSELLGPKSRFRDWSVLLESRDALHLLEDTCEDQRSAIQEWIDALDEWPDVEEPAARRERELLRVRSRDVLEHIERVLAHVRRLEQSAENAVQMHFSALGHRTNDIMRTLTVLTAIFMPLNLVTGFFGMNFDNLPLIHSATGVWVTVLLMVVTGMTLGGFFWRKRYLGTRSRS
ncbi:MAG: magnesium transporter CorA family protein [Rubrivivax sp.]